MMEGARKAVLVASMVCVLILGATDAGKLCSNETDFTAVPTNIRDSTGYNAYRRSIDWKGFMNAIDCIGKREGAFCPFVTRMVFHDGGAVNEDIPTGADGSVMTSFMEGISPANVQYGEAPIVRFMLKRLVRKYRISFADGLGVASLVCTNVMGSDVNVQKVCTQEGTPFAVGKLDALVDFNKVIFDLPFPSTDFKSFVTFWMTSLNGVIKDSKWKFTPKDVAALMGSHAVNVPHGCTRGKGGYRNRIFDNAYFKDLLSGSVIVAESAADKCGEKPCMPFPEKSESAGCFFDDAGFEKKITIARAQVAEAQTANGFGFSTVFTGYPSANWVPDSSRAECTGPQCVCCSAYDTVNSTSTRPFCVGRMPGECYWPYTVNDAHVKVGIQSNPPASPDLLNAFKLFRDDLGAFRKQYAVGLCKLNRVAANFGTAGEANLHRLVGDHVGKCEELSRADKAFVQMAFGVPKCNVPASSQVKGRQPFEFTI